MNNLGIFVPGFESLTPLRQCFAIEHFVELLRDEDARVEEAQIDPLYCDNLNEKSVFFMPLVPPLPPGATEYFHGALECSVCSNKAALVRPGTHGATLVVCLVCSCHATMALDSNISKAGYEIKGRYLGMPGVASTSFREFLRRRRIGYGAVEERSKKFLPSMPEHLPPVTFSFVGGAAADHPGTPEAASTPLVSADHPGTPLKKRGRPKKEQPTDLTGQVIMPFAIPTPAPTPVNPAPEAPVGANSTPIESKEPSTAEILVQAQAGFDERQTTSELVSKEVDKPQASVLEYEDYQWNQYVCDDQNCLSDQLLIRVRPNQIGTIQASYRCLSCQRTGNFPMPENDVREMQAKGIRFIEGQEIPAVQTAPVVPTQEPEKKKRGRPKKNNETFTEDDGAGVPNPKPTPVIPDLPLTAAPVARSAVVDKILAAKPGLVDVEGTINSILGMIEAWPEDRVVKKWEELTSQTWVKSKRSLADLRSEIADSIVGKTMGVKK